MRRLVLLQQRELGVSLAIEPHATFDLQLDQSTLTNGVPFSGSLDASAAPRTASRKSVLANGWHANDDHSPSLLSREAAFSAG